MDNLEAWKTFSDYMESHIKRKAIAYEMPDSNFNQLAITDERICLWNILKYTIRTWNGRAKGEELVKITHYAQVAWTIGGKNDKSIAG